MTLHRICLEKVMTKPAPPSKRGRDGEGLVEAQIPLTGWMDILDAYELLQVMKRELGAPFVNVERKQLFVLGLQRMDTDVVPHGDTMVRVPPEIRARVADALAKFAAEPAVIAGGRLSS